MSGSKTWRVGAHVRAFRSFRAPEPEEQDGGSHRQENRDDRDRAMSSAPCQQDHGGDEESASTR